ncbi:PREDICTED: small nuclear ribonucleoprotein E [Ficedula albicollis]|uniref:small nuclear ribonucleoprotein E n=1 Tax=Ficedula albicollis TaxID=59894 RepID=UPI0007AD95C5|nr:PREDICTED: small nuclear ribonucleoprotein E [Ficedula albicollis]
MLLPADTIGLVFDLVGQINGKTPVPRLLHCCGRGFPSGLWGSASRVSLRAPRVPLSGFGFGLLRARSRPRALSRLCCALNAPLQNLIFRYLQNRSRIQVWLYEQVNMRIEGCIIGFDEYMNLVLDDAEEIHSKTKSRKQLGRIMLKGDNITLLQSVSN